MKKKPTEKQARLLGQMIARAFIEMRMLGWLGKADQAADLADAFHNLPLYLFSDDFDWYFFRECFLKAYQQKYPRAEHDFNYLSMLDHIESLHERDDQ